MPPDAITTVWALTAVDGHFSVVEHRNGGPWHRQDFAVDERRQYERTVRLAAEDRDVLLSAAPRPEPGLGMADRAACLWARVESKAQKAALKAFRPAPTVVLQEGSTCRQVALWALDEPLAHDWVVRANKRLAHRFGSPKKHAAAEFMFPAPGSCLRHGRTRPVLVREWVNPSLPIYRPRDVVARLRDAPEPHDWRNEA